MNVSEMVITQANRTCPIFNDSLACSGQASLVFCSPTIYRLDMNRVLQQSFGLKQGKRPAWHRAMTRGAGTLTYNTCKRPSLLFAIAFLHLSTNLRGVDELPCQKATPKHLAADTVKSNHSPATEELQFLPFPTLAQTKSCHYFHFRSSSQTSFGSFQKTAC